MPRRRRREQPERTASSDRWKHAVFIVALVGAVIAIDQWGIRWFQAPWSYAALGPTLTGSWDGQVRAGLGSEYRLFLEMEYRHHGRRLRRGDQNLEGRGWICTRTGDIYEYALQGDASRTGDSISITLAHPDPARSALDATLLGNWDGQTLTLKPTRNQFQPDGSFVLNAPAGSTDPDDSFGPAALHKGDRASFLVACGRLTR